MNSFGSVGELRTDVSIGVGGIEEVGVGLEGKLLGGAIGNVKESRLEFRDVVEVERVDRVCGVSVRGGGELRHESLSTSPLSPAPSVCAARGDVGAAVVEAGSLVEVEPAAISGLAASAASSEAAGSRVLRRRRCSTAIFAQTNDLINLRSERDCKMCVGRFSFDRRLKKGVAGELAARRCLYLPLKDRLEYKAVMMLLILLLLKRVLLE